MCEDFCLFFVSLELQVKHDFSCVLVGRRTGGGNGYRKMSFAELQGANSRSDELACVCPHQAPQMLEVGKCLAAHPDCCRGSAG